MGQLGVFRNRASILLVDDVRANLLALSALLKPLGARIVEAASAMEALDAVRSEPFAVALVDVQMPEMDGFELAAAIHELDYGRELPILFVTAIHREESYARYGYKLGAADYIIKPFDGDIVKAKVKAFIDLFERSERIRSAELSVRIRERDDALRRATASERIATAALEKPEALMGELLEIFLSVTDTAESAAIFVRDDATFSLGAFAGVKKPVYEKLSESIARQYSKARNEPGAPNIPDPRILSRAPRPSEISAFDCVPLLYDGEVLGVACLGSTRVTGFSEADLRLFAVVAERAAWAAAKRLEFTQLYEVFSALPALLSVVRVPSMKYAFASPAYRALFGGRELLGASAAEFGMGPAALALIREAHQSEKMIDAEELYFVLNGAEHFVQYSAQPLRNHAGVIDRVLTFATDITPQVVARKRIEAHEAERTVLLAKEQAARSEAERASQAKDEFVAMISHELRTPLQAILGWSTIARTKAPPELQPALDTIERNAKRQASIIEDLLDISRIISGNLKLEFKEMDLAPLIRNAIETVRPAANAKKITLEMALDNLGRLVGDVERLQQILGNILSNAVKFTPEHGKITLRATLEEKSVTIAVTDTGEGIDPAFLPNIFEAFRQANGSATRRHSGLGLGLAIVKRLVEAHGGTIRVTSGGRGQGATFTIDLPRNAASGAGARALLGLSNSADHKGETLDGLKVLVVDDDSEARTLLEYVLRDRGALVLTASSAAAGLSAVASFRPDVLVSDIAMPEMDGNHMMRAIRGLAPDSGGKTPAIALSAHGREEDNDRSLAAGFRMYFVKPVDIESLVSAVAALASEACHLNGEVKTSRNLDPLSIGTRS